ncbi:MAG: pyridoxal phosphate-dependent aminotransferase [Planktomarina sp.]
MEPSHRSQVDPFIVMDIMEAARAAEAEGRRIIHMEVGQPGTPAPKAARDAVAHMMEHDPMGYTVALGLPELRARISRHYGESYGVDLDPGRVVVTPGSSAGFLLAFTALFDAGDRVGIAAPGYPSYRQILKALSLTAVDVETPEAQNFQPRPADFAPHDLNGILVASPANPTGAVLPQADLQELADWTERTGTAFISDEIYHGITYDAPAETALEVTDRCYVINSFSKYFSMTGWRIGWMVVPEDHVRGIERLAQNMFICAPHVSQVAALAAFDAGDELENNIKTYAANRALLKDALPKMGLGNFTTPDGAFYFYVDVSHVTQNSLELAADILDKAGVAVTPGVDFDPKRGMQRLRLSYARATADIEEGISRLAAYFGGTS